MEEKKVVEKEAKEVRKLTEPELEKVVGGAPQGVQSEAIAPVDTKVIIPIHPSS